VAGGHLGPAHHRIAAASVRKPFAAVASGLAPVNSQVAKNPLRSAPVTTDACWTKSSMVALPKRLVVVH
jgi:hypothetical protein